MITQTRKVLRQKKLFNKCPVQTPSRNLKAIRGIQISDRIFKIKIRTSEQLRSVDLDGWLTKLLES